MFGLGEQRSKALYGAVFDIGSESIGIAIVESGPDVQYPKLIFSHRIHMRISKKEPTISERVRTMRETLFSASLIISRDGLDAPAHHNKHAHVTQMLVTCSAPWAYTISRNVAYEGETELKVSKDLINDLILSAESEIEKHVSSIETPPELNFEIVERATIDVRVNDYPTIQPIGLHGKEISLAHVTGLIPKEVVTALTEVGNKVFPHLKMRTHTFMLVLYCVLREIYTSHPSVTMIHISGDTTEIGIVEGDTLVETLVVPVGLEHIARNLMHSDKESLSEIYTLLNLYQNGDLNPDATKRVDTALSSYIDAFKQSLEGQVTSRRFPKTMFILAPTKFSELFKRALDPYLQEELGANGDILTLSTDVIDATPLSGENDANLVVASRFFHKLHGCGEIGSN